MTVKNIKSILNGTMIHESLVYGELKNKTIAIDLPIYFYKQIQKTNKSFALRNLFHFITRFLQKNINLIFISETSLTSNIYNSFYELIDLCGQPLIITSTDSEAVAAYLTMTGKADAVFTTDYDALIFGAKTMYVKTEKAYVKYILSSELLSLGLTDRKQLIDLALWIGTDYNEGVKGIGPKKALNLVKNGDTGIQMIPDYKKLFSLFWNDLKTEFHTKPAQIDMKKLIKFLQGQEFNIDLYRNQIEFLRHFDSSSRSVLDYYFGGKK